MKTLALDLSLSCTGWAARYGEFIESGTQDFPIVKGKDPALRFDVFEKWLNILLDTYEPDAVAYEQQLHRGIGATEAACGLSTRVKVACARRGIPYRSLYSTSLKKFATGKGNADKDAMKQSAWIRWPHYNITTDKGGDEADALWLLEWLRSQIEVTEVQP